MDAVVLVCALADTPHIVRGSVFTHECAFCFRTLCVAPSGQRILRKHPQAKTLCIQCFRRLPNAADFAVDLAGSVGEIREEELRAQPQPNYYRRRN